MAAKKMEESRSRIHDYELFEFLGEGSTAQVYLAQEKSRQQPVAIKIIDKNLVRQMQMEAKIQQEIRLHQALKNPHILHVHETFEDSINYYMVLEYCEHRSLADVMKDPDKGALLDRAKPQNVFRQIVKGVLYLHETAQIIHRDLKLANILLSDNDTIRLSDFGLATKITNHHSTFCGTPNFLAPEILQTTKGYSQAVDIWSLGCILHCLLLKKPPFEGKKVSDTFTNIASVEVNPIVLPRTLSASASDLIRRLLHFDPSKRPSARQMLRHPWLRKPNDAFQTPEHQIIKRSTRRTRTSRGTKKMARPSSGRRVVTPRRDINVDPDEEDAYESIYLDFDSVSSRSSESDSSPVKSSLSVKTEPIVESKEEAEIQEMVALLSLMTDSTPESKTEAFIARSIIQADIEDVPRLGIIGKKVALSWTLYEDVEYNILRRFFLRIPSILTAVYIPSAGVICGQKTGRRDTNVPFTFSLTKKSVPAELMQPFSPLNHAQGPPIVPENFKIPLIRLCFWLSMRSAMIRSNMRFGHDTTDPYISYSTLPSSLLQSLRRSSIEQQVWQRIEECCPPSTEINDRNCEIVGIGKAELSYSGLLKVIFCDGSTLELSQNGSELRFRESEQNNWDSFDLTGKDASPVYLPTIVTKKLEFVPRFIRQFQVLRAQTRNA